MGQSLCIIQLSFRNVIFYVYVLNFLYKRFKITETVLSTYF